MKLYCCAVFDAKVDAFVTPFFVRSLGEALRSFEDACRDEKSSFFHHAGDYSLFHVGFFTDDEGSLTALGVPVKVATALEFVPRPGQLKAVEK